MNKEPSTQMTLLTPLQPPDSCSPDNSNHDDQHPPSNHQSSIEASCSETFQAVNKELATKVAAVEDNGRERLKRHRIEAAGRVWIPDIWGQEEMLKDWIDCSAFDACLDGSNIMSARAALAHFCSIKNKK